MNKVAVSSVAVVAGLAGWLVVSTQSAHAVPEFNKAFKEKYIGDKSTDAQKKLDTAVEAAKCDVCHDSTKKGPDGKDSKKNRNAYGEALHKHIHKKDKADKAKIAAALGKVEADKAGKDGATFGESLKDGKLPVVVGGGK